MLFLLIVFLVSTISIAVLLFVGTLFFQGYFYTEPAEGLVWRATAAGASLSLLLTFWAMLTLNADDARPENLPYNTIFAFSPDEDMFDQPVKELHVQQRGRQGKVRYRRRMIDGLRYRYKTPDSGQNLPLDKIEAVHIERDGQTIAFHRVEPTDGGNLVFVSEDGWTMPVYRHLSGNPTRFRWGAFLSNVLLNVLHFAVWFVVLWLLLRFRWGHALGLAVVLWLITTLALLPMLLGQAATRAQSNARAPVPIQRPDHYADARMCRMSPSSITYVFPSNL